MLSGQTPRSRMLIVAFAIAGIIALYAWKAASYETPFDPTFSATASITAGLVLLIAVTLRSGKIARDAPKVIDELRTVLGDLVTEQRLPRGQRPTGAADESLQRAYAHVEAAGHGIAAGRESDAANLLSNAVTESRGWQADAPTTLSLLALDTSVADLAATHERSLQMMRQRPSLRRRMREEQAAADED